MRSSRASLVLVTLLFTTLAPITNVMAQRAYNVKEVSTKRRGVGDPRFDSPVGTVKKKRVQVSVKSGAADGPTKHSGAKTEVVKPKTASRGLMVQRAIGEALRVVGVVGLLPVGLGVVSMVTGLMGGPDIDPTARATLVTGGFKMLAFAAPISAFFSILGTQMSYKDYPEQP